MIQSMPDASPVRWHLAHTTWFFETFVLKYREEFQPFDDHYAYLFNSYYNTVGKQFPRPQRGMLSRPTVQEVWEYRHEIDRLLTRFISEMSEPLWRKLAPVLVLGLHHEQQHQELLLTDVKHMFAQNPLLPAYRDADPGHGTSASSARAAGSPELSWVAYPEQLGEIGHAGAGFAFDNESPRHRQFLGDYQLGQRLVTCGDFLEFMRDGGYRRPDLWLSLGWDTLRREGWEAPLYWRDKDGSWSVYTMWGERDVCPAEPVCHVSYFEADAYARWAGARLPTEGEWEIAAASLPSAGNFVEDRHFAPVPNSASDNSVPAQMFGDVWEWTSSPYSAYPGFRASEGALGEYNGKFMCNQFVLRGGSCCTSASHIRTSYRNFFPPDARWQFSGIRLARE